ncbi:conserved hypothetical protein (plasmid) [Rhodococcus jostii RHA1]|uniref:Uncharacterized protein n=1 Tax=Rhodococcus jostii (strain RHA1) TaxID=101510 RepID=Q0RV50_RHOJR|nr:hypothetical protein [Rhodococcus jostii]ABH00836.1 conserved hypothetical protein [Rhodococcus jostii RHA1]
MSFTVHDTANVAKILAEILGGTVEVPARPPYGPQSLFVCLWDEHGTLIELAPTGSAWVPNDKALPIETKLDDLVQQHDYLHSFWDAAVSFDRIREICEEQGWRYYITDQKIKIAVVWIENHRYIEFCPKEHVPAYLEIYGTAGKDKYQDYVASRVAAIKATQAAQLNKP